MAYPYQVISPLIMPIDADNYKDAVKKFVKVNRDISLNQLIVADQLNNNRMLANIKYYQNNGRNKISANIAPTLLNTIPDTTGGGFMFGSPYNSIGMMTMGSGGPIPVNPMGMGIGDPIPFNPMFYGQMSTPVAGTGTFFPSTTKITLGDYINPGAAVFPVGRIKEAGRNDLTVVNPPGHEGYPVGYALNQADSVLPVGTAIQLGTILLPTTVFNGTTTFPLGTVLKQGCNFPAGTNLPRGTILSLGTFIDLTGVANDITAPAGGLNAFQLMQQIPFGRCRLTRDVFIPAGGVLKVGFKFTSGSKIIDGTIFDGTTVPQSVFLNGSEIVGPTMTNNNNNGMNPMPIAIPYGMGPIGMPGLPPPIAVPAGFPMMGIAPVMNNYKAKRR